MSSQEESTQYEKPALSDLQGAWQNLSETIEQPLFPEWERLLFHIDEEMSEERVRNPEPMRATVLLIHNIAAEADMPQAVTD
jgi:hypothetical protein